MPRMVTPYAQQVARWNLQETSRAAWIELRRGGLGGSDVPAVAAMDPARSRWEVYLSKVAPDLDRDEPEDGSRLEERFWFGHQMEHVAARRFKMRHPGTRVSRLGMIARKDAPWMRVNVDYMVHGCPDGPCILEIKNRDKFAARDWDPDGDPEKIPDAAAIQTLWGLIVLGGPAAGYSHAHLLAVIGGNELREYTIRYDPALAATVTEEGSWFWHEHVLTRVPPPVDATERTGKILARLWDVDEDAIITAGPDEEALVARLRAADASADTAVKAAALIEHELMVAMGPAEVLLAKDGHRLVTWKQNSTFREGDFRKEQPELAAAYSRSKDVTDTQRLAADHPKTYRAYRARAFRIAPLPKETKRP